MQWESAYISYYIIYTRIFIKEIREKVDILLSLHMYVYLRIVYTLIPFPSLFFSLHFFSVKQKVITFWNVCLYLQGWRRTSRTAKKDTQSLNMGGWHWCFFYHSHFYSCRLSSFFFLLSDVWWLWRESEWTVRWNIVTMCWEK